MYEVLVEHGEVYELLSSLRLFLMRTYTKNTDLGAKWYDEVRTSLSAELLATLDENYCKYFDYLDILCWKTKLGGSIRDFTRWLGSASIGQLFEYLAPYSSTVPADIGEIRDRFVEWIGRWNEEYFSRFCTDEVKHALHHSAEGIKRLQTTNTAPEVVEIASAGVVPDPQNLETVVLVPTLHFRPVVIYGLRPPLLFIHYPTEVVADNSHCFDMLKALKSYADEHRIEVLRYLATGQKSFPEIQKYYRKISKGALHYHMVQLRSAGVVRFHINAADGVDRYSLREESVHELYHQLCGHLSLDTRGRTSK